MPVVSPPLDLKRHLLTRVSLFALAVLLMGSAALLLEARYRVPRDIQRTGHTIRLLISDEVAHRHTSFEQTLGELDLSLAGLTPIGELVHFCIRFTDLYEHPVGSRCFSGDTRLPAVLESLMQAAIGPGAAYEGSIGVYPGKSVGNVEITPNYGSELLELGRRLRNLLAVCGLILFMNFLIYRPVRNALAPADTLLQTLVRMERGELQARMPEFALIEFDRIGRGFNHLADRLEATIQEQRRLAHRLLTVREEERQHLARELHDEFGQYLASINAEAAFARELADEGLPALKPCADSISRTTRHMMETLHQILHRLRPLGLEEFGLAASLEQLVADWNRRCREQTAFVLSIDGDWDRLADDVNVSVYRIVQESITNALRHGRARQVSIALRRDGDGLHLEIADDGSAAPEVPDGPGRKGGGFGLLGMEERVLALGGRLRMERLQPQGTRVRVELPVAEVLEAAP